MKSRVTMKFFLLFMSCMTLLSCSDDSDDEMGGMEPGVPENPITGKNITYTLNAVAVANISGEAKFIENTDNTVTIELSLNNTPAGGQHPAHIHYNTAAEGGAIALTLGVVDGTTGKSSTTVSALDDGTVINYDDLLAFSGYINVHLSADDLSTIVGQGDIGVNALTGTSKSYELMEKAVPGIQGTVTFFERLSGEALSVIELTNTPENGVHPAHIHVNSVVEGGDGGNCNQCNRLRLTADGNIKPCLFNELSFNVRKLGIEEAYQQAVGKKPKTGSYNKSGDFYNIGG